MKENFSYKCVTLRGYFKQTLITSVDSISNFVFAADS